MNIYWESPLPYQLAPLANAFGIISGFWSYEPYQTTYIELAAAIMGQCQLLSLITYWWIDLRGFSILSSTIFAMAKLWFEQDEYMLMYSGQYWYAYPFTVMSLLLNIPALLYYIDLTQDVREDWPRDDQVLRAAADRSFFSRAISYITQSDYATRPVAFQLIPVASVLGIWSGRAHQFDTGAIDENVDSWMGQFQIITLILFWWEETRTFSLVANFFMNAIKLFYVYQDWDLFDTDQDYLTQWYWPIFALGIDLIAMQSYFDFTKGNPNYKDASSADENAEDAPTEDNEEDFYYYY